MRTVAAVLFAVVIWAIGWLLVGAIMVGIAFLAVQSGARPGLIHALVTWLLGPAVGGYLAIQVTARVFESADMRAVFVSFITLVSVLIIAVMLIGVGSIAGGQPFGGLLLSLLQCVSIIAGAFVAKNTLSN